MDDFNLYLAAGQGLHPVADWAVDAVLTCGPGIALCTGIYLLLCVVERIRDRRAVRRQLRRERQQMARLRAAIDNAPLIPTQPGHDDELLDKCWAAWNAQPRKEKPQP